MTDFEPPTATGHPRQHGAYISLSIEIYHGAHPNRATLLADYSSLLAALSDAKLTKVRDALPPARDLFGDEGAAAFLQTEQSYNVQLPSSASSMGSSPCESRGSSSGLQHRLATQRRPSPALHWDRLHPTRTSRTRCSPGTRATCGAPGPAARTPASGPEAAPLTHSRDRIRTPSLAIAVHAGMCFLG